MSDNSSFFLNGKEIKRQPVRCYCRVMGYLRDWTGYNIGKKSEFFSRKYFKMPDLENDPKMLKIQNAEFVNIYG